MQAVQDRKVGSPSTCFVGPLPMVGAATTSFRGLEQSLTRPVLPYVVSRQRASPCVTVITMLRVRGHRKPEDWDRKMKTLSGRFLPLDPRDEVILDVLEKGRCGPEMITAEEYGEEGPPSSEYGTSNKPQWSRRAEAAKKRWADPEYRAKILAKREEKKRRDIESGKRPADTKPKVHIGATDSITMSSDIKAREINNYARSNKLRSEKISAYHRDRAAWMENRLSEGEEARFQRTRDEFKKQRQEARQAIARRRHARRREAKARQDGLLDEEEEEDDVRRPWRASQRRAWRRHQSTVERNG